MNKKFIIYRTACAVIMLLASLLSSTATYAADESVKLRLGGEGATNWAIGNIKPGDSGTKTVALTNTGALDGTVTIWLSSISNTEGANPESESGNTAEPGELGNYLKLAISASGLNTNLNLPVTVNDFPQSAAGAHYVRLNPLRAGTTVSLTWNWELPAAVGNDVQGDSLSFTFNYALEELLPPPDNSGSGSGSGDGSAVTPPDTGIKVDTNRPMDVVIPDGKTSLTVTGDGTLTESYTVALPDNELVLGFTGNTRVELSDGSVPDHLGIKLADHSPPVPANLVQVSPAYDLSGYTADGVAQSVQFDQPIRLVIAYDLNRLPRDTSSIFIAYYDEKAGWTQLEPPIGFVADVGQATAQVNHFTLFAVFAQITWIMPPEPRPTPSVVPQPPLSTARFELSDLKVSPAQVKPGESALVTARLSNDGGLAGEHIMETRVTGILQKSESILLLPGESRKISFHITPGKLGLYMVEIDDLSAVLVVVAPPATTTPPTVPPRVPETEPNPWLWLTPFFAFIVIALSVMLSSRARRQRK